MSARENRRNGAVLVVVALSMIAAAVVGAAILAKATSARYERVQFGIANKAYYLAESDAAYVCARAAAEIYYPPFAGHPPITNVLANGDWFIVTAYRTNVMTVTTNAGVTNFASALHNIGTSIGVAHPGTALEARRQIHFDMLVSGKMIDDFPGDEGSLMTGDPAKPDYHDDMFAETGASKVEIKDTGPSQGIAVAPKLDKGPGEASLALHWWNSVSLSNAMAYVYWANDRLLSYDVQTKVGYFPNAPSTHWMMGISFRLHESAQTYGLSFFHSATNVSTDGAPWVDQLDANFHLLRGTNYYAVLWYRAATNTPLKLINSHRLPTDYLYLDKGQYELKYYNTLLLRIDEEYADATRSNRQNRIVAYLATTNLNPIWPSYYTSNAVWQENATNFPAPITWDQAPYAPATGDQTTNVDGRITSAGFPGIRNAEIGVHLFYDRNAANELFLRDFAIRFDSFGSPFGGTQIQW